MHFFPSQVSPGQQLGAAFLHLEPHSCARVRGPAHFLCSSEKKGAVLSIQRIELVLLICLRFLLYLPLTHLQYW